MKNEKMINNNKKSLFPQHTPPHIMTLFVIRLLAKLKHIIKLKKRKQQ